MNTAVAEVKAKTLAEAFLFFIKVLDKPHYVMYNSDS